MKKLIFVALTIVFSVIILSCSSNDDDNKNQTFPFQGKWSGTYSGAKDHGTFKMDVSSKGIITGTSSSAVFNENYSVDGSVSESGSFTAIAGSATSGATFTGQMNGNSVNGTWVNNSAAMNGVWSGNKN